MSRSKFAPLGFDCPYQNACPHLEWLSTSWVWSQYQRGNKSYHEQLEMNDLLDGHLDAALKRIRVLEKELAELRAKYQALHQKQFKANRKKEIRKEEPSGPKKRGAPVGHPGWFRPKPTQEDRTVHVSAPEQCPYCHSTRLSPIQETWEHLQEDIVLVSQPRVTRYRHEQAFCHGCRRPVVQAADDEILQAPIGPVTKATAMYLRYEIGIPYRKVAEIFKVLFGLSVVPASLVGFDQKGVKRGKEIYEDLREKLRASPVVHADETSWRNDGLGHYVWYGGNDHLAFFHIDRHRSAEAAKSIFGTNFTGTLIRDRYAAYNGIGLHFQACLAHLLTTTKEIKREHALLPPREQDPQVETFTTGLKDFFSKACEVGRKLKAGDLSLLGAVKIENRFIRELRKICKKPLAFKPAERLRTYLLGPEQKNLFTFLRIPDVSPTNNQAEQSLRKMVIFRKVCFGTRSPNGLLTHSVLPSLVQTAKRQGVHPLSFLKTLLTASTATAQASLYNNSS
jgi:transposase